MRLVRWRLLLRAPDGGPLPATPLWHAVAIGFMANNMLPFRAGELVRLLAASRLAGVRFSAVLSSIAVERIFDGLAVVALLSVALLASDLPPDVAVGGVSVRHAAQVGGHDGRGGAGRRAAGGRVSAGRPSALIARSAAGGQADRAPGRR